MAARQRQPADARAHLLTNGLLRRRSVPLRIGIPAFA
jgi:hypothetical protein